MPGSRRPLFRELCRWTARRVDVLAVPKLERQQTPEELRAIPSARLVGGDEGLDSRQVPKAAAFGSLSEQEVGHVLSKLFPEPSGEGDSETVLGTVPHLTGQRLPDGVEEERLGTVADSLPGRGKGGHELHHAVVQERNPDLEG